MSLIDLCCWNVQLICTVTPSTSNSEETHNTLKFAHRAKHIEIQAAQNKVRCFVLHLDESAQLNRAFLALNNPSHSTLQIIDEKSLIKKYQYEIRCLKEELEQLKQGIMRVPRAKDIGEDDIVLLKQKVCLNLSMAETFHF